MFRPAFVTLMLLSGTQAHAFGGLLQGIVQQAVGSAVQQAAAPAPATAPAAAVGANGCAANLPPMPLGMQAYNPDLDGNGCIDATELAGYNQAMAGAAVYNAAAGHGVTGGLPVSGAAGGVAGAAMGALMGAAIQNATSGAAQNAPASAGSDTGFAFSSD